MITPMMMAWHIRKITLLIFPQVKPTNSTASATATPLDDLIQTRRDFAKKTGYSLTRFTMNTETWEYVLKAEDTKKQVLGITAYNGGIRLQQSQVTEYLRGYGIEIEVYDKLYIDRTDNKTKYFVPTGIVSCQSGGIYLGDYVFGKTPEERSGSLTDGNLSIVETVFLYMHMLQTIQSIHIALYP